jgi:hypothetical protein
VGVHLKGMPPQAVCGPPEYGERFRPLLAHMNILIEGGGLGIVTGALTIISEALRLILGIGYIVFFVLEVIWFIAVVWKLYRLGRE